MKNRIKKSILAASFMLLCSSGILFAEGGLFFGLDYPLSIVKPTFLAEEIGYKYNFNDVIGLRGGVRFMENLYQVSTEPILYIAPVIDFNASIWYIGAGCFIPIQGNTTPSVYVRTGLNFGNWQAGPGKIGINLSLEISGTVAPVVSDSGNSTGNALGDAIGTIFATILNFPKFNIGVTYYLPFLSSGSRSSSRASTSSTSDTSSESSSTSESSSMSSTSSSSSSI